ADAKDLVDAVVDEAIRRGAGESHRTPWSESMLSPRPPDPPVAPPPAAVEATPDEEHDPNEPQPKVRGKRFPDLVELYEREYAVPAVRRDGKKIAGMASWKKHR